MFVVLWEYEVKPGCEQAFEKVYGPGGDWDSLFHSDANHAGTYLFRTRLGRAFISRRTIGIPVSLAKNFCKRGETTISH